MIFKDKSFEKVVTKALNKLKSDDFNDIKGILISNTDINSIQAPFNSHASAYNMTFPEVMFNSSNSENGSWIEDLKMFKDIKSLHLYTSVNDLSFLKDFINLRELYITNSIETNWTFLNNITKLHCLLVDNCNLFDLEPLANLCKKQIEDFDKAKKDANGQFILFEGLSNLCLNNCKITDVSAIAEGMHISDLNLSNNNITDISPLGKLDFLHYLNLSHNNIENISSLKEKRGLYLLNLRHNNISNISVLKSLENSNLTRLYLEYNKIIDYSSILNIRLKDDDVFVGYGKDKFIRTDTVNRISEQFLGNVKYNDDKSKISNPQLRMIVMQYESVGIYYGKEEWDKFKRIYLILGINKTANTTKDYDQYIHTSLIKKIILEDNNTTIRIITSNSEYVFNGDPEEILDYYTKNFLNTPTV